MLYLHLLYQQALLAEQDFLLLDAFITLCHLFTQALIFFFHAHASTLLGFTTFGKSPADLGSYVLSSLGLVGLHVKQSDRARQIGLTGIVMLFPGNLGLAVYYILLFSPAIYP